MSGECLEQLLPCSGSAIATHLCFNLPLTPIKASATEPEHKAEYGCVLPGDKTLEIRVQLHGSESDRAIAGCITAIACLTA